MTPLALQLARNYYFFEAMAFYEAYYSPALDRITASAPVRVRELLATPGRREDHPLTWVPIVFHCTSFDSFERIVASGEVLSPVHLTELPIGELDRMKLRTSGEHQVAIGFPRRYIQTRGAASVLHTKHNPELTAFLNNNPKVKEQLQPFLAIDDDVSAFQELRCAMPLDISQAIWLLTTDRKTDEGNVQHLVMPAKADFERQWGKIPCSFWHRSHQMGILGEWQYLHVERQDGELNAVTVLGEHYWRQEGFQDEEHVVRMPVGRDWALRFKARKPSSTAYDGPFSFFELARRMKVLLREHLKDEPELPFALMPTI